MRVRLPANVEMPDRIVAGLTARQLAIIAGDGLLIWLLYVAVGRSLRPAIFSVMALPLAAAGALLIAKTPDGIGFDRLLVLAARFLIRPKRSVLAPDGLSRRQFRGSVAPIDFPIRNVTHDDLIDLGPEGFAAVCKASGVPLTLLSEAEQAALVETFARFLNSVDGSLQFLIVSRTIELGAYLSALSERARLFSHPALEEAARRHIKYLEQLGERRDVRRRELLVCFRDAAAPQADASARLTRKIDQAQNLLRGLGVSLRRLSSDEAGRYLRTCGDPEGQPPPVGADLTLSTVEGVSA